MSDLSKIQVLTFSGWGQMPDALNCVIPSEIPHIQNVVYHHLPDREAVFQKLKAQSLRADIVIGWSLGGKMAARAVAMRILKPRLLVLLGTPFQYIPDGGIENVIKGKPYKHFYEAFEAEPDVTCAAFVDYITAGDAKACDIRKRLVLDKAHDKDWLRWLIGMKFGSEDLDFTHMPRTLVVHGRNDAIINLRQPQLYGERITNSRMELLEGCGHAPHLHAPDVIADFIRKESARLQIKGFQ